MNNKIGFSNFRKFANFPEIDLGDITILVGGNNSGKSTLVKAFLGPLEKVCGYRSTIKILFCPFIKLNNG